MFMREQNFAKYERFSTVLADQMLQSLLLLQFNSETHKCIIKMIKFDAHTNTFIIPFSAEPYLEEN